MLEKITSPHNPRIRKLILLQSKSRERRKLNRILIEGYREISRALTSGFVVKELYCCPDLDVGERYRQLASLYPEIELFTVSAVVFERLAYREGSDGLIALAEPRYTSVNELKISKSPLIIILESVEKPGNLGAVMRTADAAGVDAVIICDPLTDLFNPNTIRSSVGCIFTKQVAVGTIDGVMNWLEKQGINCYAAALTDNAKNYNLIDYRGPTAFVMGTESTGLSNLWLKSSTCHVKIPMNGIADSLNVSVSTAILVFEAMRQRNFNQ
jgi:RNA methyltransferase, TrmH family